MEKVDDPIAVNSQWWHSSGVIKFAVLSLAVCVTSACSSQSTTIATASSSGSPRCEAGDVLKISPVSPESVEIQGLPDSAVIRKGYAVSSSSNCSFAVRGFVPQYYPYIILSSGLGARIDLNSPQSSSSVIEPLGKPTMREIPLHCQPLARDKWKTTATVARCDEAEHVETGITFGKPLDAPVTSIGAFQPTSRNTAVLLYGYQNISELSFLSLTD